MLGRTLSGKSILAGSAMVMLMALVGCQSSGGNMSASAPTMSKGVLITTKTGSVVYVPTADGTDAKMMSTAGEHECAACKTAAMQYFRTGDLTPHCPNCGGLRSPIANAQ